MIGRRAKREREDENRAASDEVAESPLFNLEELHERRIHSWSPEPEEDLPGESDEAAGADEATGPEAGPAEPPAVVTPAPTARPEQRPTLVREPARPAAARAPRPAPAPVATRPAAPRLEPPTDDAAKVDRARDESPGSDPPARRRGRPRGRPRRQVHFHVDPDEERLLMAAVAVYGSQQKGLIAALRSLQETDELRAEIARLEAECERQRELLDRAESLFKP